ncbi:hypothetical protein B7R78_0006950 [Ralstonia solanacearum]|uniref:Uncharacterized protein n=1 Tax=Ralstonia solanacearum K60 TaxID=1091042 RepID=A0AAP7ZQ88_RALSL|nr:hypothetical protein [Ralstonia solanacearum]MBT1536869.1 hypothetical protein [Ralstonia solanacearum]OYQ14772.1 hypothetical protein B7R77_17000 [Ralstonia solanacearum K60]QOK83486.1 hypothetical protein HF906_15810 [Ralstonia solanacearum]CCF97979.1 hypothetical protein RSK60_3430002 [Ralstonia solanacearum K60]
MKMDDNAWKTFFTTCADILGVGAPTASQSNTWCSWTTFGRLREDAGYWQSGLPNRSDIHDAWIGDGGVWRQPFPYADLAHIIIPREFYWERISKEGFESGVNLQNIESLSIELREKGIEHRKTDLLLEIKLY